MELLDHVVVRGLSIPALNKWTKVEPVIAKVAVMVSFCKLVRVALQKHLGAKCDDDDESDFSDDAQVGAPKDEMKTNRKLNTKRNVKTLSFVEAADTQWRLFLWLSVSLPVMTIHYRLFKFGTWHSHCRDNRCGLFEFCNDDTNPAKRALFILTSMLCDSSGTGAGHWDVLIRQHGQSHTWPRELLKEAQNSTILTICSLWRRLVVIWKSYPWLLVRAVDQRLPLETREQVAQEFMDVDECCLDQQFSRRLRRLVTTPSELLEQDMCSFLHTMFTRVVVTSTFAERIFRNLSEWTRARRLSLSTLAATHVVNSFKEAVQHARDDAGASTRSSKARPAWIKTKNEGACCTGLHLFQKRRRTETHMGDGSNDFLKQTIDEWRQLSAQERDRFSRQARTKRIASTLEDAPLDEALNTDAADVPFGPWHLGSADGQWPISHDVVATATQGKGKFETCHKQWLEDCLVIK
jgi:hypothetical protein